MPSLTTDIAKFRGRVREPIDSTMTIPARENLSPRTPCIAISIAGRAVRFIGIGAVTNAVNTADV
jgi:hypothetical protein